MADSIREEGFLVIESDSGGLSGWAEFHTTREQAESVAKSRVQNDNRSFPVFVIPITRFTTEHIRAMRGNRSL